MHPSIPDSPIITPSVESGVPRKPDIYNAEILKRGYIKDRNEEYYAWIEVSENGKSLEKVSDDGKGWRSTEADPREEDR